MQARDERTDGGKGHIIIPEWMTQAQVNAVNTLYQRNPDGAADRWEFWTRVKEGGFGSDRYAVVHCATCMWASSRTATGTHKQIYTNREGFRDADN